MAHSRRDLLDELDEMFDPPSNPTSSSHPYRHAQADTMFDELSSMDIGKLE